MIIALTKLITHTHTYICNKEISIENYVISLTLSAHSDPINASLPYVYILHKE